MTVQISARVRNAAAVERLLDTLPDWFGVPSANAEYVASAERLPTYLAWEEGVVVGALLLDTHFATTSEITLLLVDPAWHRRGVGRALVAAAEEDLIAEGMALLEVKTLGPSSDHEGYAGTRAFYQALGFLPVEELHGVWPHDPCLILVKPLAIGSP